MYTISPFDGDRYYIAIFSSEISRAINMVWNTDTHTRTSIQAVHKRAKQRETRSYTTLIDCTRLRHQLASIFNALFILDGCVAIQYL